MRLKKAVISLAATATMIGASLTTTAPAFAAGTAPACIARKFEASNIIRLTNNCGRVMYVNVVIDWGPDSGCRAMDAGDYMVYGWAWGIYDHVETCAQ